MGELLSVEVVYALPEMQTVRILHLPKGKTVQDALVISGILSDYPELTLANLVVGIYGQKVALDEVLKPEDRIEIYRPLLQDPKEQRRVKANKKPLK